VQTGASAGTWVGNAAFEQAEQCLKKLMNEKSEEGNGEAVWRRQNRVPEQKHRVFWRKKKRSRGKSFFLKEAKHRGSWCRVSKKEGQSMERGGERKFATGKALNGHAKTRVPEVQERKRKERLKCGRG